MFVQTKSENANYLQQLKAIREREREIKEAACRKDRCRDIYGIDLGIICYTKHSTSAEIILNIRRKEGKIVSSSVQCSASDS